VSRRKAQETVEERKRDTGIMSVAINVPPVEKFSLEDSSNVGQRWQKWKKSFNIYMTASGVTGDAQKRALLLHLAGPEVHDIFETLEVDGTAFKDAEKALDNYFVKKKNVAFERHIFRQAVQNSQETMDNFITRLRQLIVSCEYPADQKNDIIRDQVIEKCKSQRLRVRLLRETDLTLEKIQQMARLHEAAETQAKQIENDATVSSPHSVNKIYTQRSSTRGREDRWGSLGRGRAANHTHHTLKTGSCWRCGRPGHYQYDCTVARDKESHKCHKKGHLAAMCRSRNQEEGPKARPQERRDRGFTEGGKKNQEPYRNCSSYKPGRGHKNQANFVQEYDGVTSDELSESECVFNMRGFPTNDLPMLKLGINGVAVECLVDSGASCNIVSEVTLQELAVDLLPCDRQLFPYGVSIPLVVKGKFSAEVSHKDKKMVAEFVVVKGKSVSLIGAKTAMRLGVLRVGDLQDDAVNMVNKSKGFEYLKSKYEKCFKGLGKLTQYQLKLHIDENVKPIAQPIRRVPFNLRQGIEEKLDELQDLDIIEPVEGPTSWVSAPVAVPKSGNLNDIRLCLDMRRVNEAILRTRHPIPTIDELLLDMNGAQIFSKLDLKWGFHQIELAPESRHITTFVTHKGLFRYKRLMFGVSCAPEEYQNILQQVLQGCEGVKVIADDIIVYGSNEEEHRQRLEKVLGTLCHRNLTLNPKKCEFGMDKLVFMGHVLSKNGIGPSNTKVEAVEKAKRPETSAEVKSFLGLVGYCGRYIDNLATREEPLRMLTHSNQPWVWSTEQEDAFNDMKKQLTCAETMAYFDVKARTQVIVDASPVGLDAILSRQQSDECFKPVMYASRSLSDVERRYSQTEKEALAVVWACERFRLYLYGLEFELVTDHKPLECIYSPKSKPPLRIERWALRLQPYRFKVKYQPGKFNAADALSRLPLKDIPKSNVAEDYVYAIAKHATPVAMTTKDIELESAVDETMCAVRRALRTDVWDELPKFKHVHQELTSVGKLVLRGSRICIPEKLQKQVLSLAHEGHQGIVKCKQRLREKVWWPGIDKDMENFVKSCRSCQLMSADTKPEPLQPTVLPDRPWQQIGIDLCGPFPGGEHLLVGVDYYSRWFEVEILHATTSSKIVETLDNWFTNHGIPEVIISDNGPQFRSEEFVRYVQSLGVTHRKITPYSPQANGEVERQNKTLLKAIRIAHSEGKDWKRELNKFLVAYRSTPHSVTGKSPFEIMYGRKMKTKLPSPNKESDVCDDIIRERDMNRKTN